MNTVRTQRATSDIYHKFSGIDGSHPLKTANPNGVVEYRARRRHDGEVAYFNFSLAKEIGLIPEDHPEKLYSALQKKILEAFSLVIINEYDIENNIIYPERDILPNTYMATRYLQLQHPNKQGKTSGDGRSIWNGYIEHNGQYWDISSCGTGATRLSPATSIYKKFFQTGDPSISYGCGYSEFDEGLATLFMSEVLHENDLATERVLAIIKFKNGYAVNVRAHQNLLRPSHFFMYIKQNQYEPLKRLTNYYIQRETGVTAFRNASSEKKHYRLFLENIANTFAKMAAKMEDEYIFCWLDWDGDNILMDGGIIDYGSLRQFGLFHHEYRYDDVQRFSTSIKEQKNKARHTVQTFAQIYDFLLTGDKKRLDSFKHHWSTKLYDATFELHKDYNLLHKIGFTPDQARLLVNKYRKAVHAFRKEFSYFERCKSKEGPQPVADGINHSAIFCMRDILRELPQIYLVNAQHISNDEFIEIIRSYYAIEDDLQLSTYRRKKIASFQKHYWRLVDAVCKAEKVDRENVLSDIACRSAVINKYDRMTGNAVCHIVDKVVKHRPKLQGEEINQLVKHLVHYQNLNPDHKSDKHIITNKLQRLFMSFVATIKYNREGL